MNALKDFSWGQLAATAAQAAASKSPGVAKWADTIGNLAGQAVDLTRNAQEVCQ